MTNKEQLQFRAQLWQVVKASKAVNPAWSHKAPVLHASLKDVRMKALRMLECIGQYRTAQLRKK